MNDFAALGKLIAGLGDLAETGMVEAEDGAAEEVGKLLERQYQEGRGPGQVNWSPLVSGVQSHLTKSGNMRKNTKALRGVRGVDVRIPSPGGFHQDGTSRMDARPLVPDGDLPPEWEAALAGPADKVIAKRLGG